ncbi:DUF3168 domain-containing protein [Caballeronia sp. EK]|uniref:DUF3168 domain-containing protein n=1 Tax=Caballeronia sp. EK TaxID=2767469 RepID=UPI0016562D8F|nr:DUF3168 domain-containing protein [Caballeronia sp. EK]MBC8638269.1 DUF3168 domain-containing protein [Caballeronia sp. EK]
MTEEQLFDLLDSVMPGKVFTPIAKTGTPEPYLIYQDITSLPQNSMCGYANLDHVIWQVDSYASTRKEAKANMAAVLRALRAYDPQPTIENMQSLYEVETRLNRRMVQVNTWESTGETA